VSPAVHVPPCQEQQAGAQHETMSGEVPGKEKQEKEAQASTETTGRGPERARSLGTSLVLLPVVPERSSEGERGSSAGGSSDAPPSTSEEQQVPAPGMPPRGPRPGSAPSTAQPTSQGRAAISRLSKSSGGSLLTAAAREAAEAATAENEGNTAHGLQQPGDVVSRYMSAVAQQEQLSTEVQDAGVASQQHTATEPPGILGDQDSRHEAGHTAPEAGGAAAQGESRSCDTVSEGYTRDTEEAAEAGCSDMPGSAMQVVGQQVVGQHIEPVTPPEAAATQQKGDQRPEPELHVHSPSSQVVDAVEAIGALLREEPVSPRRQQPSPFAAHASRPETHDSLGLAHPESPPSPCRDTPSSVSAPAADDQAPSVSATHPPPPPPPLTAPQFFSSPSRREVVAATLHHQDSGLLASTRALCAEPLIHKPRHVMSTASCITLSDTVLLPSIPAGGSAPSEQDGGSTSVMSCCRHSDATNADYSAASLPSASTDIEFCRKDVAIRAADPHAPSNPLVPAAARAALRSLHRSHRPATATAKAQDSIAQWYGGLAHYNMQHQMYTTAAARGARTAQLVEQERERRQVQALAALRPQQAVVVTGARPGVTSHLVHSPLMWAQFPGGTSRPVRYLEWAVF
jgi:hypothetical protein